jgi:hypothetical protein
MKLLLVARSAGIANMSALVARIIGVVRPEQSPPSEPEPSNKQQR